MKRLENPRILRRDWVGDALLTLLCGAMLVAAVFLPWANVDDEGFVNYALSKPADVNGVLQTQWGVPALGLALLVVGVGLLMAFTRPRRFSILLGLLVATCGLAVAAVAADAAAHIGFMSPGVGMYLSLLTGVLLVPIGLAASLVAWILARADRRAPDGPPASTTLPATAPPAAESAPPS